MTWITTHFVNPAMLTGLALVAAPIIIWLFNRVRYRTVEWAAQTFLLRALKRSQSRLRIENFLLLLIRCLILAFFVGAIARPRGQPMAAIDPTDARRNVVIMIDTSWSTGYQIGSDAQQTVHEREKRAAKDIVRQLRPVDRVSVIAFDEQPRKIYSTPRAVDARAQREILDELETLPEVQRGARGTDYASAFHMLPEVLKRFDAGPDGQPPPAELPPSPKTVFLLTDMQRVGLLNGTNLKDPTLRGVADDVKKLGAQFFICDCGADEPKNAGIVSLEAGEPIVGVNLPCSIECTVRNFGALTPVRGVAGAHGEKISGLTLEYFVDGSDTPVKAVSLDLLPEETKQLEPLRYTFHEKGPHRVIARLKSDALQLDNERALVVDVREAVDVLLVDGEPKTEKWESETDFLQLALDPYGAAGVGKHILRTEVVMEGALPVANLRKYEVVVLANVVSLPDEHIAALEQYAKDGGAVIFTMGGLIDRDHYNDKLWRRGTGMFPCQLGEIRGTALSERSGDRDPNASEWVFALTNPEHPALGVFAEEEMRPHLKYPSFYRYIEAKDLTAVPDKGPAGLASVPLRFVPRPKSEGEKDDPNALRDASAAIVEKNYGRGRVLAFMSTVDAAWTNMPVYDINLVFWRQIALELARTSRPRRNLMIGERYERVIGTNEYAPTVEVTAPDGAKETFRPEAIEGREQFRISYPPSPDQRVGSGSDNPTAPAPPPPATPPAPGAKDGAAPRHDDNGADKPGVYEVRMTGGAGDSVPPPPDYFAVRLEPSEGDVAKLDVEDWREQLPSLDVKKALPDSVGEAFQGTVAGNQGDELWPYAVAAVITLLALESLLAALFGRRRQ
jgi:hypothetical protein